MCVQQEVHVGQMAKTQVQKVQLTGAAAQRSDTLFSSGSGRQQINCRFAPEVFHSRYPIVHQKVVH